MVGICWWPELESELDKRFLEHQAIGETTRKVWFWISGEEIFSKLYPNASLSVFRFSNGWFAAFLRRYRVSLRCITKKTQKIPEVYSNLVINCLWFNRRNSQPKPSCWSEVVLNRAVGRYYLNNIYNLDETPIPFEYFNSRTYDRIGSKLFG